MALAHMNQPRPQRKAGDFTRDLFGCLNRINADRRINAKVRQATPTHVIAEVLRGAWGAPSPKTVRVLH